MKSQKSDSSDSSDSYFRPKNRVRFFTWSEFYLYI